MSARLNLEPFPENRVGLIGGYLIYSTDTNPSYIPLNIGPSQEGLFDYSFSEGAFALKSPNTLIIQKTGYYNISLSVFVASNTQGVAVFEVLTGNNAVGTTPPVIATGGELFSSGLAPNYTFVSALNATSNAYLTSGTNLVVAYTSSIDAEVTLTSNLSITLLKEQ